MFLEKKENLSNFLEKLKSLFLNVLFVGLPAEQKKRIVN